MHDQKTLRKIPLRSCDEDVIVDCTNILFPGEAGSQTPEIAALAYYKEFPDSSLIRLPLIGCSGKVTGLFAPGGDTSWTDDDLIVSFETTKIEAHWDSWDNRDRGIIWYEDMHGSSRAQFLTIRYRIELRPDGNLVGILPAKLSPEYKVTVDETEVKGPERDAVIAKLLNVTLGGETVFGQLPHPVVPYVTDAELVGLKQMLPRTPKRFGYPARVRMFRQSLGLPVDSA